MTPHFLITRYWAYVVARGETPRPVWAMISTGVVQPKGYTMGWSVNKRETEKRAALAGNCEVVRIDYVSP